MLNLLVTFWLNFLRVILVILHFTYSGFQFFNLAWSLLNRKLKNIFQFHIHESDIFVTRFVEKLKKRPSHFLVIVGADGINVEDFSNLVIWCLAAKISFVTFHDHTGYLKANENIYYKYLINKRKLDPKCLIFNSDKLNTKNGFFQKIHLNILSPENGKPLFVKLAKNLSLKVVSNEMKTTNIQERLISEEMLKLSGIPEPELGVICGTICCTFGFIPWHLRITEFIQVKHLKGIQVSEFTSILRTYSSCTQRFGK